MWGRSRNHLLILPLILVPSHFIRLVQGQNITYLFDHQQFTPHTVNAIFFITKGSIIKTLLISARCLSFATMPGLLQRKPFPTSAPSWIFLRRFIQDIAAGAIKSNDGNEIKSNDGTTLRFSRRDVPNRHMVIPKKVRGHVQPQVA